MRRGSAAGVGKAMAVGALVAATLATLASCGARTPLEDPPPLESPPIDSSIVDACARLVSCDESAGIGACLYAATRDGRIPWALEERWIFASCVDRAGGDCAAVSRCQLGDMGPCPAGERDHCDGSREVYCWGGDLLVDDCADGSLLDTDPGATCFVGTDGATRCGFATCPTPAPPDHCEGNTEVTCDHGVLERLTCSPGVCSMGSQGPRCAGTGAPCTQDRCDGDTLMQCLGRREQPFACDQLPIPSVCGQGCAYGVCPVSRCLPSSRLSCDPLSHVDTCDGTRIVYCDGQERTVDCAALGFTTCVAVPGGANCR